VHGLELDPDGDGSILRAEVEAEVNRVFASFDVNKDGEVSADEFKRRPSYRSPFSGFVGEHFTGMDTNGDGILQAAEFVREVLRMFDKQDVNRDGVLTPSEWRDGVSQPERKKQN
jgi:Ca2+-binding EF-hand superfamily protein